MTVDATVPESCIPAALLFYTYIEEKTGVGQLSDKPNVSQVQTAEQIGGKQQTETAPVAMEQMKA
jgi:hypothetical protein